MKKDKFEVKIDRDVSLRGYFVMISQNGLQWHGIRVYSSKQAKKIIKALEKEVAKELE